MATGKSLVHGLFLIDQNRRVIPPGSSMVNSADSHLSRMTATDLYRYLALEHEATTVAALIGIATANRGTADPATARVCFLHLPARHPLSFPELELPALVQSAALLSVGILYDSTADRMIVEILLAEIGSQPSGDVAISTHLKKATTLPLLDSRSD